MLGCPAIFANPRSRQRCEPTRRPPLGIALAKLRRRLTSRVHSSVNVIAPEAWGRGDATEIATAGVAHALEVLGARDLYGSVLSTNVASRRGLDKAGLEVHCEIDHGEHVEAIYAIGR